jgi:hypothetical protein
VVASLINDLLLVVQQVMCRSCLADLLLHQAHQGSQGGHAAAPDRAAKFEIYKHILQLCELSHLSHHVTYS